MTGRVMRPVVRARMRSGRGGLLGPDTLRRMHWWECLLECGHYAEPRVRYKPRPVTPATPRANGWHPRDEDDALPAPRRARCHDCEVGR